MGHCANYFSRYIVNMHPLFVKEVITITSPRCMLRAQLICHYSEACKCTPRITAVIDFAALDLRTSYLMPK